MKTIRYPERKDWENILKRPSQSVESIEDTVYEIFTEVKQKGDVAINKYTELFDGKCPQSLRVTNEELAVVDREITEELKEAIQLAKANITRFHSAQRIPDIEVETMEGVHCWQEKKAIEKVGLYIPGGSAPLFSTILMLAVPAKLAGCEEIILCTPPNKDGNIHPAILYTAKICGVKNIFKVGGIQAIAAMTFGSESIPSVYKIFGPGNQYVTVAKQLATKFGVAIDLPAGPSELMVYADSSANAAFVASDLLSQAEHGIDSQVILLSNSEKLLSEVTEEIECQIEILPRASIAEKAMENSKSILLKDPTEALDLINFYGPEHLIIASIDEDHIAENIRNAGSVFIGSYTPESAGDYASGTNHTLPTNGFAKQYSGVNLDSFLKNITFQKISKKGLQHIGPSIELMAAAEGLEGHKKAITLRLNEIKNNE